jgi:hypothetical protein
MATAPVNAPLSSVNTSSAPTETFEPLQISATGARKGYGQHTTMSMSRDTLFAEATTCTGRHSRFNPLNKHNFGYKQASSQRSAEKSVLATHDPCSAVGRKVQTRSKSTQDATRTRPSRAAHHARIRDAMGLGGPEGPARYTEQPWWIRTSYLVGKLFGIVKGRGVHLPVAGDAVLAVAAAEPHRHT